MFKKYLSLLVVFIMVFSLVACSQPVEKETSMDVSKEVTETTTVAITEEETEQTTAVVVQQTAMEALVSAYFENMPKHIYKIDQVEFTDMVKAGIDGTVLDIRNAKDYGIGHVKGAVNAPWGTAIADSLTKIPMDKPVYVYCYSGQTAGQAVATLNIAGFNARSVNLGYNFGISKVEGVDQIITKDDTTLTEDVSTIDPAVKIALEEYYKGLAEVKDTQYANYKISEKDLKGLMESNEKFTLVSIRKAEDYALGHITGAINMPYGKETAKYFSELPTDEKVVVYCYSGQTAGQTVAAMRLIGIDAVSLNGGVGVGANAPLGWINQGYGLVSDAINEKIMAYFKNMPEHIYKIPQAEFVDLVTAGTDATILDIRSDKDYATSHVKGAINAPWGPAISDVLTKIPQDKPLYVYCYTGQTAGQAVMTLNLAGFDARSVNLGFNMGITKVEGADTIMTSEATLTGDDITTIDPAVEQALKVYYAGLAGVKESIYANYKISEDNLKQLIDENEDFYLLSIRSAEDYKAAHIKGAVNLPWGKDMADGFKDIPIDKPVVVYCYTGQTAGQTVAALRLMGVNAVSLNGGMGMEANKPMGWANKGYEVVTE